MFEQPQPYQMPDERTEMLKRFYERMKNEINQAEKLSQITAIRARINNPDAHNFHRFEGFNGIREELLKQCDQQAKHLLTFELEVA